MSSYQEQRAAEKAREAQLRADTLETMRAVAFAGGWTFVPDEGDWRTYAAGGTFTIPAADDVPEVKLSVTRQFDRPERFAFGIVYLRKADGGACTARDCMNMQEQEGLTTEISCAANRSPVVLHREISRRLLPSAQQITARALVMIQAARDEAARVKAAILGLAKALGAPPPADSQYRSGYFSLPGALASGHVEVRSSGSYHFNFSVYDEALALRVVSLLKGGAA